MLVLLIGFQGLLTGQVLKQKTGIKDEPRGEVSWELQPGQALYAGAPEDGWYPVRKKLRAALTSWDGTALQEGATLYNKEGDSIGRTLESLELVEVDTVDPFRLDSYLLGIG